MTPPLQRGSKRTRRIKLRMSVFLVLAGVVLGLGVAKLAYPLTMLRAQQVRLAQLRSERLSLIAERDRLRRDERRLATEAGQEAVARRRGYVRPGERRLMFVRTDAAEPEPVDQLAPEPR